MSNGRSEPPLESCFAALARHGELPLTEWPDDQDPADFGLIVESGRVLPSVRHDPLSPAAIRAALSSRADAWLRRLDVFPVIGSTNQHLMDRAGQESVDGSVCMAEIQLHGRGRRGRGWVSPFGANLAISLGVAVDVPPARLGGAALVAGLAVLDAVETRGARGLCLKWPNDLLLGDAKVGGILIEVSQRRGVELVIGIGLNVTLPEAVKRRLPDNVGDLSRAGVVAARSEIAAAVVSSVIDFVGAFERSGFEAFRAAFDARHGYHGRTCDVLLADGPVTGTVVGVSAQGELTLRTAEGDRRFNAGDVSLRQKT